MDAAAKDNEALRHATDSVRAAEASLARLETRHRSEAEGDQDLQACLAAIASARKSLRKLSRKLKSYAAMQ